jgi:hypothetical protein
MIRYTKHGLRMGELWLDEPVQRASDVDVILLHQYGSLPAGAVGSPFHSLVLDLSLSEDELLNGLNRDTKYKVRRAEGKDAATCEQFVQPSDALCAEFIEFFNAFAADKGIAQVVSAEFYARAKVKRLWISRASIGGQAVVWHVHALGGGRVSLLHSASHFRQSDDTEMRNAIGRANRLLHWNDIVHAKAQGLTGYDFGGWYAGEEDQGLLKINQFKEGFGGTRVQQCNAAIATSWRGWLYLKLLQRLSGAQRKRLAAWLAGWKGRRRTQTAAA